MTRAKRRVNRVNNTAHSDAEWADHINDAGKELWDFLNFELGDPWLAAYDATTVAAGGNIDLAAIALAGSGTVPYKLLEVQALFTVGSGVHAVTLRRLQRAFLPLLDTNTQTWTEAMARSGRLRYALSGWNIDFQPPPASSVSVAVLHIPTFPEMTTGAATLLQALEPWSEFLVIEAGRRILEKEMRDTSGLERDKAAMLERIRLAALPRDYQADQVQDVYGHTPWLGTLDDEVLPRP